MPKQRLPSPLDEEYPVLDDMLREDVCIVCKRRPRETPHGLCHACDAALHGG